MAFQGGPTNERVRRARDHSQALSPAAAFLFILYFICYLDRINVGFAALTR
jgi:hypothetical protein